MQPYAYDIGDFALDDDDEWLEKARVEATTKKRPLHREHSGEKWEANHDEIRKQRTGKPTGSADDELCDAMWSIDSFRMTPRELDQIRLDTETKGTTADRFLDVSQAFSRMPPKTGGRAGCFHAHDKKFFGQANRMFSGLESFLVQLGCGKQEACSYYPELMASPDALLNDMAGRSFNAIAFSAFWFSLLGAIGSEGCRRSRAASIARLAKGVDSRHTSSNSAD